MKKLFVNIKRQFRNWFGFIRFALDTRYANNSTQPKSRVYGTKIKWNVPTKSKEES